jgi:hypothetical protein
MCTYGNSTEYIYNEVCKTLATFPLQGICRIFHHYRVPVTKQNIFQYNRIVDMYCNGVLILEKKMLLDIFMSQCVNLNLLQVKICYYETNYDTKSYLLFLR